MNSESPMQIRLYDMEAQRRPIMSFDYGESPIKSLTLDGDGYTVYVGTGSGDLACFDMRTGKHIKTIIFLGIVNKQTFLNVQIRELCIALSVRAFVLFYVWHVGVWYCS